MGVIQIKTKMTIRKKYLANETKAYILVSNVIDGETWFHALGGLYFPYHLDIPFERLDVPQSGYHR